MTTLHPEPPAGRGLTVADIELMPDDGHYELIDGVLVMAPTPQWHHSLMSDEIFALLRAAAPSELRVMHAPAAVIIDERTWVEPDVFVSAKADFGDKYAERPPLLAVEVLSPASRLYDLTTKFERYERAGVASYWALDPDPDAPRLIVWELEQGRFVKAADVSGDQTWTSTRPFAVTFSPAALLPG